MNEEERKLLLDLIYEHCGISISGAHLEFLKRYIKSCIENTGLSFDDYYKILKEKNKEFELLINAITISETYFFREEKQFLYLHDSVLPQMKNTNLSIWSAACSTGEEAYSLGALCKSLDLSPKLYASDINTDSLKKLKNAQYSYTSFREDGKVFRNLLNPYASFDEKNIFISNELRAMVHSFPFNLYHFDGCTECLSDVFFDIIFLRNVFIYFTEKTKLACMHYMEEKLKPGGLLFVSTNEIASINVPKTSNLKKVKDSGVFFFVKEKEVL